jgi:hypothetical protein
MTTYLRSIYVIEGPEASFVAVKNKITKRFTRFEGDRSASDAADEVSFGLFDSDEISPNPEFALFIFKSNKTVEQSLAISRDLHALISPSWDSVRLAEIVLDRKNRPQAFIQMNGPQKRADLTDLEISMEVTRTRLCASMYGRTPGFKRWLRAWRARGHKLLIHPQAGESSLGLCPVSPNARASGTEYVQVPPTPQFPN